MKWRARRRNFGPWCSAYFPSRSHPAQRSSAVDVDNLEEARENDRALRDRPHRETTDMSGLLSGNLPALAAIGSPAVSAVRLQAHLRAASVCPDGPPQPDLPIITTAMHTRTARWGEWVGLVCGSGVTDYRKRHESAALEFWESKGSTARD